MMAATGVLGIWQADSTSDTGVVFMGLYMLIFALILAIFEISQLRPTMGIDNLWKRNFGFLYGPIGRGIYMIFIAILCFGIEKPYDLALASGVVIIFFGCIQIFMSIWYLVTLTKRKVSTLDSDWCIIFSCIIVLCQVYLLRFLLRFTLQGTSTPTSTVHSNIQIQITSSK